MIPDVKRGYYADVTLLDAFTSGDRDPTVPAPKGSSQLGPTDLECPSSMASSVTHVEELR